MSDANKETIADIIAKKRQYADDLERACNEIAADAPLMAKKANECKCTVVADIRREADRLEAAHRREAAQLREALTKCYQLAYEWEANEREGIAGVEPGAKDSAETLLDIQQITTAALAATETKGEKQ